jgi:hypothetical protein
MLDKFIFIEEAGGIAGQNSQGIWLCKELRFKDANDLEIKGKQINHALNILNHAQKKKGSKTKLPSPPSKGKGLD